MGNALRVLGAVLAAGLVVPLAGCAAGLAARDDVTVTVSEATPAGEPTDPVAAPAPLADDPSDTSATPLLEDYAWQEAAGQALGRVREQFPDDFAGADVGAVPFLVYFAGAAPAGAADLLDAQPTAYRVVEDIGHTETELGDATRTVHVAVSALLPDGASITTSTDQVTGVVQVVFGAPLEGTADADGAAAVEERAVEVGRRALADSGLGAERFPVTAIYDPTLVSGGDEG